MIGKGLHLSVGNTHVTPWQKRFTTDQRVGVRIVESKLNKDEADRVAEAIKQRAEQLSDVEMNLTLESAGVAQAVDALRKALDQVEDRLRDRQYEAVANLGYRDVSSEFIFLQRTMGSLLTAAHCRASLISDIAGATLLPYEAVEPLVVEETRRAEETGD